MCNKITQNRHDEPFFTMNTPRCEVTTSTNLGQIRASSPPTRELTCTLVCGQKSKYSKDEDFSKAWLLDHASIIFGIMVRFLG